MASVAQIEANRLNAQRSTGPKTPEGKAASAHNHTKYGLFARRDAVPAHLQAAYEDFRDGHLKELAPATRMELAHAKEIVSALWRLERIAQLEAESNADPCDAEGQTFERARTTASRALNRAMQNLRHDQSNRFARLLTYGSTDHDDFAFSDFRDVYNAMSARPAYIMKEVKSIRATNNRTAAAASVEFLPNWQSFDPDPDEAESDPTEIDPDETETIEPESPEPETDVDSAGLADDPEPVENKTQDFSHRTQFEPQAAGNEREPIRIDAPANARIPNRPPIPVTDN